MATSVFADIENAILAKLQDESLKDGRDNVISEFDVRRGVESIDKTPAVSVAMESCSSARIDKVTFKLTPEFAVYLVFKSLKDEKHRRQGAYPMVEGSFQILLLQKFAEVEMDPLLPSGPIREVFDEDLSERGMVAFRIPFKTSFEVAKMTDEDALELLRLGMTYYLQPEDQNPDATDLIEFEEQT